MFIQVALGCDSTVTTILTVLPEFIVSLQANGGVTAMYWFSYIARYDELCIYS